MAKGIRLGRRQVLAGIGLSSMASSAAFAFGSPAPSIVETRAGMVRGARSGAVHSFLGIPYAADTGGRNRFRRPQPVQAWAGVRDAVDYGAIAPQATSPAWRTGAGLAAFTRLRQSEDCLSVNVWTPAVGRADKPVMVWLHGGGFARGASGSGIGDGAALAQRENVVVVSLNHRLNAFGFLDLGALGGGAFQTANLGMMDIVAGLEWVRDNIASFGGDPSRVMVFGASGGARKVATLMAMPSAKGLFHAAAMQGAGCLEPCDREDGARMAHSLAGQLGVSGRSVADRLRTVPTAAVIDAIGRLGTGARFRPAVDGESVIDHPFAPGAAGLSDHVPLLIGFARTAPGGEGGGGFAAVDERALERKLASMFETDEADEVLRRYRRHERMETPAGAHYRSSLDEWLQRSAVRTAMRREAGGAAPTFLFMIDGRMDMQRTCSLHGVDVPCVLDGPEHTQSGGQMARVWSAMARTGQPGPVASSAWPACSAARRTAMVFGRDARTVDLG